MSEALATDYGITIDGRETEVVGADLDMNLETPILSGENINYPEGYEAEIEALGYREATEKFRDRFNDHYRFTEDEDAVKPWFHRAHFWIMPARTNKSNPYFNVEYTGTHSRNVDNLRWMDEDPEDITYPFPEDHVLAVFDEDEREIRVFEADPDHDTFLQSPSSDIGSRAFNPRANLYVKDDTGNLWMINIYTPIREEDFKVVVSGPFEWSGNHRTWNAGNVDVSGDVVDALHDYTEDNPVEPGEFEPTEHVEQS